eukprot:5467348-Prymnesium_polylepis.1
MGSLPQHGSQSCEGFAANKARTPCSRSARPSGAGKLRSAIRLCSAPPGMVANRAHGDPAARQPVETALTTRSSAGSSRWSASWKASSCSASAGQWSGTRCLPAYGATSKSSAIAWSASPSPSVPESMPNPKRSRSAQTAESPGLKMAGLHAGIVAKNLAPILLGC